MRHSSPFVACSFLVEGLVYAILLQSDVCSPLIGLGRVLVSPSVHY